MTEDQSPALFIRGRLLQLMSALERFGATPIETLDLHAFAFLSNVLSPVWEIEPLEDEVLKDRTRLGPYYPALQRELEQCVGGGLIEVVDLRSLDGAEGDALRATFRLATTRARPILEALDALPDEQNIVRYLDELAAAFAEINDERRDDAAALDASYSNPAVPTDRMVNFGGAPAKHNPSWNTVQSLQRYVPSGVTLNQAEKLAMYVRLLKRRANG